MVFNTKLRANSDLGLWSPILYSTTVWRGKILMGTIHWEIWFSGTTGNYYSLFQWFRNQDTCSNELNTSVASDHDIVLILEHSSMWITWSIKQAKYFSLLWLTSVPVISIFTIAGTVCTVGAITTSLIYIWTTHRWIDWSLGSYVAWRICSNVRPLE